MLTQDQLGLEEELQRGFINVQEQNGIITLTRINGEKVTFSIAPVTGDTGLKGDKGDKGETGDSAYTAYKNQSRTPLASEYNWIQSLKGEKGDKGDPGAIGFPGKDGIDGITPTLRLENVVMTEHGTMPSANLTRSGNDYSLVLRIPEGLEGYSGKDGKTPTLRIGTVTALPHGEFPTLTIDQESTQYTINLGIPMGEKGDKGADAPPSPDGTFPKIDFKVNMLAEHTAPSITSVIDGDDWTITLNIPTGYKGDKGQRGPQGRDGSTDVYYGVIKTSDLNIDSPAKDSFTAIAFRYNNVDYFGWSVRDADGTFSQIAFAEDFSHYLVRAKENNQTFGDISEGWLSSAETSIVQEEGD